MGVLFNNAETTLIKYPAAKTDITEYTIPTSVTSILGYAFQNCSALTNVSVPAGVTTLVDYTFNNCANLTEITLNGIESTAIKSNWFSGCNENLVVHCSDGVDVSPIA